MAGDVGSGRFRREYRPTTAVRAASGMAAASVWGGNLFSKIPRGRLGGSEGQSRTLKRNVVGDLGRGVCGHDAVLGPRAIGRDHDVEAHDAVTLFELGHIAADLVDVAGHVVALVVVGAQPLGDLPVLGVRAGIDDLDQDLVRLGLGDGRVNDGDRGACRD